MAISIEYVAKETASNLWGNRVMAIAAILTVAVSLSLVGTALLLRQRVSRQVGQGSDNAAGEQLPARQPQRAKDRHQQLRQQRAWHLQGDVPGPERQDPPTGHER